MEERQAFSHDRALALAVRTAASAATVLVFAVAVKCGAAEPIVLHGRTMGTTYNVKYWAASESAPAGPKLQRTIDALLSTIDEQMSTWRADSELSQFNAAPANTWFAVSPATAAVAARALELHELTGGASDVTVGPALRLWGFGSGGDKSHKPATRPSETQLAAARKLVGANRLRVRNTPPALRKDIDGLEVDLSSIAPGYAVDAIVDLLASEGIENAMVELGGEVRGVGRRSDGKPWRIGVQSPPPRGDAVACVVPLAGLAVATSGDFHNVRMIDGRRYTHIIDPRTCEPVPYRGASITVVAETCFAADGVATALFVMGARAGYEWCVANDVAALFQEIDAQGNVSLRRTPRFEELVGHE